VPRGDEQETFGIVELFEGSAEIGDLAAVHLLRCAPGRGAEFTKARDLRDDPVPIGRGGGA
jgi:hypothetical protein